MRFLAIPLAAALAVAACGGAAQPAATTAPTATAAPTPTPAPTVAATATPATKLTFDLTPKPENEVPPVANDEKAITCKATVVIDLTRDAAGKITGAKASVDISFANVPAGTAIVAGHIHGPNGAAGLVAGVKVPFKTDPDPLPVTGTTASFKKADVTVDADTANAINDKPTDWYLNFHSKLNPGGMCRAQLK